MKQFEEHMEKRRSSVAAGSDTLNSSRSQQREWRRRSRLRLLVIVGVVVAMVAVAGCGSSSSPASSGGAAPAAASSVQSKKVSVDGGSYTNVDAAGLSTMLKSKDFPLINVHVPYEGEIQGTDLFIPYTDIQNNLSKLPADKSSKIFLYCRSGNMSDIAARALVKLGYTNVWNLDGGMIAWKQAGYQVVEKAH